MAMHLPRRRTRVLRAWALVVALGLGACSGSDPAVAPRREPPPEAQPGEPVPDDESGPRPAPERVALQLEDLPEGFQRCSFSGDIDTYMENFRQASPDIYQGLRRTWEQLQASGATDGYYAFYGDSQTACDSVLNVPGDHDDLHDPQNPGGHPITVFSFVTRYEDEAAAATVYLTNVFGQSRLGSPQYDVVVAEPTGLGPNATVASSQGGPTPVWQAVWQAKAFTVFFGSENLHALDARAALDAIHGRM